jgi:hypothetical protein
MLKISISDAVKPDPFSGVCASRKNSAFFDDGKLRTLQRFVGKNASGLAATRRLFRVRRCTTEKMQGNLPHQAADARLRS